MEAEYLPRAKLTLSVRGFASQASFLKTLIKFVASQTFNKNTIIYIMKPDGYGKFNSSWRKGRTRILLFAARSI